jgi:hypothetical protein
MSLEYKVTVKETEELIKNAPFNYALDFGFGDGTLIISDEKLRLGIPYEMSKLAELRGTKQEADNG